jgi:hypothetical protein
VLDAARDQAAASKDRGEEDHILTGYCTPAFIEMEAADCAMLLGQPHQAVVIFQHGLASLPAQYQRDRAVNLARLAVAYAASREPEGACAVAQEAAAIVYSTWSARAVAERGGCRPCSPGGRIRRRLQSWRLLWRPCPDVLRSWPVAGYCPWTH